MGNESGAANSQSDFLVCALLGLGVFGPGHSIWEMKKGRRDGALFFYCATTKIVAEAPETGTVAPRRTSALRRVTVFR